MAAGSAVLSTHGGPLCRNPFMQIGATGLPEASKNDRS
jgi:hypothetical protein